MAAVLLGKFARASLQAAKETVTFAASFACPRELVLQEEEEVVEEVVVAVVAEAAMEAALPDMWPVMTNACPLAVSAATMATTAMLDKHAQLISSANLVAEVVVAAEALVVTAATTNLHPLATLSRAKGLVVLQAIKPATASHQTLNQRMLPPSQTPLADPAARTILLILSLLSPLVIAGPALPITARPSLPMLALPSLLTSAALLRLLPLARPAPTAPTAMRSALPTSSLAFSPSSPLFYNQILRCGGLRCETFGTSGLMRAIMNGGTRS